MLIANPGDIIIVPQPNYGIFDLMIEQSGVRIETIPLKKDNNYLVDVNELSFLIYKLNKSLNEENKVVAYLNINPNNPTGKVMGKKEKKLLYDLGLCCKKSNMFVIDDMVYRDLTYDRNNLAMPISSNEMLFDNVITFFGVSKSYGLAGIRGGLVIANQYIIKSIEDIIFQSMDSISVLTTSALVGTFNKKNVNSNYEKTYFNKLIKE